MAREWTALSDRITQGTVALPLTGSMAMWVYPTWSQTDGIAHFWFDQRNSGAVAFTVTKFSDNFIYLGFVNTTDYRVIVASAGYTLNQNAWNSLVITWDDTANQTKGFLNGAQIGSTTASLVAPTLTSTRNIGSQQGASTDARGRMAEFAIWNVVLTASEIATYHAGFSPRFIRPASLTDYLPLIGNYSPENNLTSGDAGTISSGTQAANHPRIIYPHKKLVYFTSSATAHIGQCDVSSLASISIVGIRDVTSDSALNVSGVVGNIGIRDSNNELILSSSTSVTQNGLRDGLSSNSLIADASTTTGSIRDVVQTVSITGVVAVSQTGIRDGVSVVDITGLATLSSVFSAEIPTNLGTMDYVSRGLPFVYTAVANIDTQTMDYPSRGLPFVTNNAAAEATNHIGQCDVVVSATINITGIRDALSSESISITSSLSTSGIRDSLGLNQVSAAVTTSSVAIKDSLGDEDLIGVVAVGNNGARDSNGELIVSSSSAVTQSGNRDALGSVNSTGVGTIGVTAEATSHTGECGLGCIATLVTVGLRDAITSIDVTGTGIIVGSSSVLDGSCNVMCNGSVGIFGVRDSIEDISISGTGLLSQLSIRDSISNTSLVGTGLITQVGLLEIQSSAFITGNTSLTQAGLRDGVQSSSSIAVVSLDGTGVRDVLGAMSTTSVLSSEVVAILNSIGINSLVGVGTLSGSADVTAAPSLPYLRYIDVTKYITKKRLNVSYIHKIHNLDSHINKYKHNILYI